MSKPITLCVFCGKPGATKGHVWPKWMKKVLPNQANKRVNLQGFYRTFKPDPAKTTPFKAVVSEGRGVTQKPRNTCLKCNSGWMSAIESNAKPSLDRLIKGEYFQLSADDQQRIACFICLVTMRAEFLDRKLAIPDSDRDWIRENYTPPPRWKIWIAWFVGASGAEFWHNRSAVQLAEKDAPPPGGPPSYNTQASTFVWGSLVSASMSSTYLPDVPGYDGQLVRVWPIQNDIIYTSRLPRLTDSAVADLGEALAKAYFS